MAPPAAEGTRLRPDTPLCCRQRGSCSKAKRITQLHGAGKAGRYVFVCTFPGHWIRMYGVMLVVPSLDQFETKPTPRPIR